MRIPQTPPSFGELLEHLRDPAVVARFAGLFDEYLHWDELRRRPLPEGIASHEIWWLLLKLRRKAGERPLPWGGFVLGESDAMRRALARADRLLAGNLGSDAQPLSEETTRRRLLLSAVREEAVQSSLLEGAATTRHEAKEMLRIQRAPRTDGERMVMNNYLAMQLIREQARQEITVEGILELHRTITAQTLPREEDEGRVRGVEDRVLVRDPEGNVLHTPPPADSVPASLDALASFASTGQPMDRYLHPVERACLVHLWLGWLHPFVDGNGRVARALFYWVMLREGYWLAEYLPISKQFRRAPGQYAKAYLHTETDGGDATYFVLHHLQVLDAALDAFNEYIDRRSRELRELDTLGPVRDRFNLRQRALLRHALQNPGFEYTFRSHGSSHEISYPTARADLFELRDAGLLVQHRAGKAFVFVPARELAERLRTLEQR